MCHDLRLQPLLPDRQILIRQIVRMRYYSSCEARSCKTGISIEDFGSSRDLFRLDDGLEVAPAAVGPDDVDGTAEGDSWRDGLGLEDGEGKRLGIVVGSLLGICDGIDDDGVKLFGTKLLVVHGSIRWWVFCRFMI